MDKVVLKDSDPKNKSAFSQLESNKYIPARYTNKPK